MHPNKSSCLVNVLFYQLFNLVRLSAFQNVLGMTQRRRPCALFANVKTIGRTGYAARAIAP